MKPSFADLPTVLLEIIMSQLVLKDNIRASAACKSWLEAAVSVRVVEKHPWILYFPKHGHLFKLCDPLTWKSNPLKLPELAGSTVCYSRDGWLLMHRCESQDTFFFNPFSKELISLPKIDLSFREIAFSCSPTSDDCVVVAIHFAVSISTCCPGATEWFTKHHIIFPPFQTQSRPFHKQSTLLYVDDQFYGFNEAIGCLYSFYPYSRRLYVHSSACIDRYQQSSGCQKTVFLGEKKGELFLICTSGNEKPLVYKLVSWKWEEMSNAMLDGLTIFVSLYNSELRTNLPWMRNNLYFSRFGYNRKRASYSFDEDRYTPPMKWNRWLELCPPQCVWIDPPNNVLDICERALHEI
ncbi:F-box protein At4g00893 [Eutrema salsugineum]|uniref:F-box protein At4g00893 n=1 Tax=Eutrema salsugineum TaxID=72664 RepID=UPI000CED3C59|nr:F-box protein At4g00893 [Eutrema salsugineum]